VIKTVEDDVYIIDVSIGKFGNIVAILNSEDSTVGRYVSKYKHGQWID